MGEVWCATDTKLNRDVAIKILPDAFANDPDGIAVHPRGASAGVAQPSEYRRDLWRRGAGAGHAIGRGRDVTSRVAPVTALNYACQTAEALSCSAT